jgi:hypothetical protein
MPKGPKGEKRPADVIGNAVRVMEIATGQREEEYDAADEGKDKAAAELGRRLVRAAVAPCWAGSWDVRRQCASDAARIIVPQAASGGGTASGAAGRM